MMCIFLPSLAAFTVFSFYYGFQKFDYHVPRFGFLCIYSAWDFVELLGDTHMCVCVFTFKKLLTFFFFSNCFSVHPLLHCFFPLGLQFMYVRCFTNHRNCFIFLSILFSLCFSFYYLNYSVFSFSKLLFCCIQ